MSYLLDPRLPGPGTLALVGSGEYLPQIDELDRWLIARLKAPARVVCLPTAAGTEGDERIAYWSDLGVDHFTQLGVQQVQALRVIDHQTASDPALAQQVRAANFVYLSGGKPTYLYASLRGTPVWQAILDVLANGGVVAGCSAGAMIFGERIPTSLFSSQWQEAFTLLPQAFIMPHFNEIPRMMLSGMRLVAGKLTIFGVEGFTALVCGPDGLSARGRGQVVLINDGTEQAYTDGQYIFNTPQKSVD
jgi:cyanophycinase